MRNSFINLYAAYTIRMKARIHISKYQLLSSDADTLSLAPERPSSLSCALHVVKRREAATTCNAVTDVASLGFQVPGCSQRQA
jgi:hypothetical protein